MTPRRPGRRLGRRLCRTKRSSRQSPATPSDTEDARLGTQANPAHVLNRDMPRGWTVIQKAVDEFDKDQIEGVKNDIDTLLVFNGLFSAVLSAFFVLAITLLQEDIPGATLTTLRHMSAQNANYTIQGDFIHSTSPAPTSFAQFEPTVNAICINDMWTASLTISLITASFSILVKQWLREYMKFVTSFPQGRLRIRNFRRAGLETWKVLTIAACLPLLLQLALGLFFIGLCFYTTELHSSVRNTTLPLVIGWGFIIFFVTVSPLFSAHCPYKTPALDSLVVAIRASVRARWIKGMEALKSRATRVCRNATTYRTLKIARIVRIQADKYITRLKDPKRPHSEATAATHAVDDLDIMVAADALQGNDDILGTAMVDALQQITAPPQGIIGFVLNILQHRVQWDGDFTSEPQIIDCSMATTRALDSIHSILEQRLPIDSISMPSDTELLPVAHWTVCLYLSLGTNRGFHKVPPSLGEYLDKRPGVFVDVAIAAPSSLGLKSLLHLTCQSCKESELDLAQSSARIKSVVKHSFQKLELGDAFELDGHDALWRRVLNEDSLRDTFEFLTDLLRDDTAVQDGEWSGAQQDALFLIIKLIAVDPWHSRDIISALRRMILLAKSDAVVVRLQMLLIKSYPNLFYLYVLHEDFRTNTAALSRHMTAIETIATDSPNQLTRLSVLKACESLALSLRHVSDDDKCTALIESWRGIFATLTSLVQAAPVFEGGTDEEARIICLCFRWLSGVDAPNEDNDLEDEEKYSKWRMAFKPEESSIPDGFYLALIDISIPETRFWRMRRLQEMTAEEREVGKKDVELYLHKFSVENSNNGVAGPPMEPGEGSGVEAGIDGGAEQADALSEAEEGRGPGNATECADAPGEAAEMIVGGLEPDANIDLILKAGSRGFGVDNGHDDEDTEPNSAVLRLPCTVPSEDAPPEAAELSDIKPPEDAPPEAEASANNSDGLFEDKDDLRRPGLAADSSWHQFGGRRYPGSSLSGEHTS